MTLTRPLSRLPRSFPRLLSTTSRLSSSDPHRHHGENKIAVNDPNAPKTVPNTSKTNEGLITSEGKTEKPLVESRDPESQRQLQAPNRADVWSRSQNPREKAMQGPRFEQTLMDYQPRPMAAIDLIHKQPVRWTDSRVVSCDGGGGPLGHPRIFINVDKPQVNMCTYCGLPFAANKHKAYLKSLPSTPYPLEPSSDPAVVDEPMRVSDEPFAQR